MSDAFGAASSDDWFDSVEQRGPSSGLAGSKCPDCGAPFQSSVYCPQTGKSHADRLPRLDPRTVIPRVPLFRDATSNARGFTDALASQIVTRTYAAGQTVFTAGDAGTQLYLVLSGRVELRTKSNTHLAFVEEGKHFGEIALLYGGVRTATARAERQSVLGCIDKPALEAAMRSQNCQEDVMKNAQHIPYVKQWFVSTVPLFQTCAHNSAFIDKISSALQYRSCQQGSTIIKEGDIGTEMYFLVSGRAEVMANNRRQKTLEQGAYFGEIAMLYGGQRNATIRAMSYCHLYVLTKPSFDTALDRFPDCVDAIFGTAQETRYLKEHFIKKLHLFQSMRNNAEFVFNMADALHSRSFRPNDYIIREDEGGTEMFFIARGDVVVEKRGAEVARMSSGDYFGELSLLYDEPRSASIKPSQYCHTYVLQQDAFEVIAIAFPDWWESITSRGAIFSRVDRSRDATQTQVHGLTLPTVHRPGSALPSRANVPHMSNQIMQAERGTAEDREALRKQLRDQGQAPRQMTAVERLQEIEDDKLCIVCADSQKCMLIVPCGHICTCQPCSTKIKDCPQCRTPIQQLFKAHY